MTIETTLERIAVALEKLASGSAALPVDRPTIKPAEVPVAPAPAAPQGQVLNFGAPAPAPAPAPAAAAPSPSVPFQDVPGLVKYTMEAYHSMDPSKGAKIQSILSNLGVDNINNVKPEQFIPFFTQMEALKAEG